MNQLMPADSFLNSQLKNQRVRSAYNEKISLIETMLASNGLSADNFRMLIVVYKDESVLEIYAGPKNAQKLNLLASYTICATSGQPGPKRMQGDGQVPEGFYHINHFNPASNYYLSLGINYPNASDLIKTTAKDPGGSIYIHGSCVTIGCLPMTDDKIKEIYLLAALSKNNGQEKIPVYIFPFRMNDKVFAAYSDKFRLNTILLDFWTNLKKGYDSFESEKTILNFSVNKKGDYCFK